MAWVRVPRQARCLPCFVLRRAADTRTRTQGCAVAAVRCACTVPRLQSAVMTFSPGRARAFDHPRAVAHPTILSPSHVLPRSLCPDRALGAPCRILIPMRIDICAAVATSTVLRIGIGIGIASWCARCTRTRTRGLLRRLTLLLLLSLQPSTLAPALLAPPGSLRVDDLLVERPRALPRAPAPTKQTLRSA